MGKKMLKKDKEKWKRRWFMRVIYTLRMVRFCRVNEEVIGLGV